jgi:hypothetical protein
MSNKLLLSLCLLLSIGLLMTAYAAQRLVVCEELYSET